MSRILLGAQRFPVYVHRGPQLNVCQALKLETHVMRELVAVIQKVGQKGPVEVHRNPDGEVTIFGEDGPPKAS